jgi:hypothetical protein
MAQQQEDIDEDGIDGDDDDDDDDQDSYAPDTPSSHSSDVGSDIVGGVIAAAADRAWPMSGTPAGPKQEGPASAPATAAADTADQHDGPTGQATQLADGNDSSVSASEGKLSASADTIDPMALLKLQSQDGEDASGSADRLQRKQPPPPRPLLVPPLSLLLATPLHIAAYFGHTNVVDALLRNAACDVRARTAQGCTALHVAAGRGHLAVVARLLRCQGLELDIPDDLGNTAMHHAAGGVLQLVLLLWGNAFICPCWQ